MTMNSHRDEPEGREEGRFEEATEDSHSAEELGSLGDWIEDLDFETLIRRYPLPALALAAVGGFVLGRTRGKTVMNALSSFAVGHISEQVNAALGKDVL